MKLWEIARFEAAYQARRPTTWLFFAGLLVFVFLQMRENFLADAMYADFFINSPFVIAVVTVIGSLFWLLVAASVAGEAAARDVETGMHPLTYSLPVSKVEVLAGRFLAAFALNAVILLAPSAGILLAVYGPGMQAEAVGPFRPEAFLTAYAYLALPNAFAVTAIQFSFAALSGRPRGT
jgi:ABC-2 type transport system permease protein